MIPPEPVRDRAVDQENPGRDEDHEGRQSHPLGKSPDDQRSGDHGEHALVDHVEKARDGRGRVLPHVPQHDVVESPDETVEDARGEGEAVGQDRPDRADQAHDQERLDDDGGRVLAPDHAAVEEADTRCHQEHECGGREHPRNVAGTHLADGADTHDVIVS